VAVALLRSVSLAPGVREEIENALANALPGECCGILVGRRQQRDLHVSRAPRARNLAPARHTDRYLIDPEDLVVADAAAEATGEEILGFYHSHPRGEPTMSLADRKQAWPGYAYLIASLRGTVRLRAWIVDAPGLPAPRGARSGLRPRTSRSALTGGWGPASPGLPARERSERPSRRPRPVAAPTAGSASPGLPVRELAIRSPGRRPGPPARRPVIRAARKHFPPPSNPV
jgi:proteasome lid subunit RPN8/RPN11